jgi:hypothetical protein
MLVEPTLAEPALDVAGRAYRQVNAPVFGMSRPVEAGMLFNQVLKIMLTVSSRIGHILYLPSTENSSSDKRPFSPNQPDPPANFDPNP